MLRAILRLRARRSDPGRILKHTLGVGMVAVMLVSAPASAQGFPNRSMRMVVGFPAAGTSDIVGRALAERLSAFMGQQVVVDNRPGAGGNIASELVAKAPPDGHVLLLSSGSNTVAPNLYDKLPYDFEKDFVHATLFADVAFLLVVHPSMPVRTVRDLIALGKSRPRELNFASPGTATPSHLAGELFRNMTGADIVHIPYKGATPAMVDLLAGRVHLYFTSIPGVLQFVNSGKLRALAVSSAKRTAVLPQIPTIAEAAVPGYVGGSWYGVSLPAGTPRDIVERFHAEVQKALVTAEFRSRLVDQGVDPVVGAGPEKFLAFIREDSARWGKVIRTSGIRAQ